MNTFKPNSFPLLLKIFTFSVSDLHIFKVDGSVRSTMLKNLFLLISLSIQYLNWAVKKKITWKGDPQTGGYCVNVQKFIFYTLGVFGP